jgi:nicotinamide riboside kinase
MEKIAFIGTFATGKTTLAHEVFTNLKKQGINAEFLSEVARTCPLSIDSNDSREVQEAQEWIIYTQCARELEYVNKCSVLICDRSVLDGYAYYINKCGENKVLENLIREKIRDYNFLIKVPINQDYLKADGIRSINLEYQKRIDASIDYLLGKFEMKYYNTSGINKIMEVIKNGRRTI